MGDFDVFDEWGNFMGKFTPAGGGCWFTIAILFLSVIGFWIYLLIKLTVNGFKSAKKGDWKRAIVYLALPIITLLSSTLPPIVEAVQFDNLCSKTQFRVARRSAGDLLYVDRAENWDYSVNVRINATQIYRGVGNEVDFGGTIEKVEATVWQYMGSPNKIRWKYCGYVYP